ncbi:uncharacterized protein N7498_008929 [Penicillium cinerascens]|uniref:Helitron helicase-like domain-containing protein n=1 Tax=Penicillium cinerascens TaxID=70096 RepID=A0A9W9MA49_9EURO|nr:uncharacterized protein N7498_008929 [Penicillium cinerascens]KAJ5195491.1 hypothetical protein N7498_008929 [Penicillium cinerascens]
MIDSWDDDFIPPDLEENIISVDLPDGHEREGYSIHLDSGNHENDLQAAQDTELDVDNNVPLMTRSVSTDINGERQSLDRRLLNALLNGYATLVDHWDNPTYFTTAFLTLFPFGIGGHLENRLFTVSLSSFAQWALKHHSRRFAQHKTFMFLIDPMIGRLLHVMKSIAIWVPGSFAQKLRMRSEIRGLIIRFGMPAFWITINPSDLRSPLMIILAGVKHSEDILSASNSAIRGATATSNPVVVASFFHYVCTAVLDGLFTSGRDYTRILGDVSNHYSVVETNGRGILHLHVMAWLKGNLSFGSLRSRVLADTEFAARVLHYLESVIIQSVDESLPLDPEVNLPLTCPSACDPELDHEFYFRLANDSNLIARSKLVHSKNHFATCFKYRPTDRAKNTCRFGMPREIVPSSEIDDLGVIYLARNHPWINPWNPAIASCLRSNHDISWIPTVSKSLTLVYYITNYATKDNMVAKGALLKQAIEKAKFTDLPTATNLRLRERGMDNFALRCFNSLAHNREIASTLLHLPSYYTVNSKFVRWLRHYIHALRSPTATDADGSTGIADEPCIFRTGDAVPVSLFNNYKWRGIALAPFSFFEYYMLVQIGQKQGSPSDRSDHFGFDSSYPKSDACV